MIVYNLANQLKKMLLDLIVNFLDHQPRLKEEEEKRDEQQKEFILRND